MSFNDGSKLGWSVSYRDGSCLTNLSYPEAMMYFAEAKDTDNPCSVLQPGYGGGIDGQTLLNEGEGL